MLRGIQFDEELLPKEESDGRIDHCSFVVLRAIS